LCAEEIRRVAAKGCHAMTFTENPAELGLPSFHDSHWDPMWRALVEEGTVVNIHLGSSGKLAVTAPDAPMDVMITLQPMNICMAAADLVWSRVFKEYKDLKVALSEGGTGWIPYFLDRLDRTYDMHHLWTGQDFGKELPSDIFRRHILTCFIADPVGVNLRNDIGIDNICWEQDYPHSDSSWPAAPEEFGAVCEKYSVPDADIDKMTHENAMHWYRFDPYKIRPRQKCTVGAGSEERRAAGQIGSGSNTRHVVSTFAVRVHEDYAVADSVWQFYVDTASTPRLQLMGTYHDECRRIGHEWKLAHRQITIG